jgi:hypothetical protein
MLFLLKKGLINALSAIRRLEQCFVCLKQAESMSFQLKRGLIVAFLVKFLTKFVEFLMVLLCSF